MRNFHAWQRRTLRRADRLLWLGAMIVVATIVAAWWISLLADGLALTLLRCIAALPLLAGAACMCGGLWTLWRLRRDPILLYYLRGGR